FGHSGIRTSARAHLSFSLQGTRGQHAPFNLFKEPENDMLLSLSLQGTGDRILSSLSSRGRRVACCASLMPLLLRSTYTAVRSIFSYPFQVVLSLKPCHVRTYS
ncbi:unnamed protein product, partial [Laminaria digitata]